MGATRETSAKGEKQNFDVRNVSSQSPQIQATTKQMMIARMGIVPSEMT